MAWPAPILALLYVLFVKGFLLDGWAGWFHALQHMLGCAAPALNAAPIHDFSMTSILVTGGSGYIGSHTCKTLQRAGFVPVTFDNLGRGNPEAVKWGPLAVGDLIDAARLRETIMRYRLAAVIHFAAFAYVGESGENSAAYYCNNVGGTATLLHTMRECGC